MPTDNVANDRHLGESSLPTSAASGAGQAPVVIPTEVPQDMSSGELRGSSSQHDEAGPQNLWPVEITPEDQEVPSEHNEAQASRNSSDTPKDREASSEPDEANPPASHLVDVGSEDQEASSEHDEAVAQICLPANDTAEDEDESSEHDEAGAQTSSPPTNIWRAVNIPPAGHPTTGGKGPANQTVMGDQGILDDCGASDSDMSEEDESPTDNAVANTTSKRLPANSQAECKTSSTRQGGSSESLSPNCDEVSTSSPRAAAVPERVKSILGATVAVIADSLKAAGLSTEGNKQAITERLTLYQAGLEESEYGHRCTALYKAQTQDLKARLKTLNAEFKSKIKSELVELVLIAEAERGGYPCLTEDEESGPEEDSPSPTVKKPTPPKKGVKRKADKSTAPETLKRVRIEEPVISSSEDEVEFADPGPTVASTAKAATQGVKRKHGDDSTPSSNLKRQKRQPRVTKSPSPASTQATTPKPKANLNSLQCDHFLVMDDKLDTRILFDHQPCSMAVFNAAYRILTGGAQENDASTVWNHRQKLPIFQEYIKSELDMSLKKNVDFVATQKHWEHLELEAVRVSVGDDFDTDMVDASEVSTTTHSNGTTSTTAEKAPVAADEEAASVDVGESAGASSQEDAGPVSAEHSGILVTEDPDTVAEEGSGTVPKNETPVDRQLNGYYRRLKEPDSDENLSKEEKVERRKKELYLMKKSKTPIADPEFKEVRKHGEY